ncbi:MAG: hypothetical protein CMN85_19295 [Spongiibacteraceae bacterium]|nr:hypothetical protein [Spongiibacteraceae bacterium]
MQPTGLDASFLYLETPNALMHMSSLAIYDQSSAPRGKIRFKDIVSNVSDRSQRKPICSFSAERKLRFYV